MAGANPELTTLMRLRDSDLMLADAAEDVRGCKVLDAGREEMGEVDALMVDDLHRHVRFLLVATGGFLGFGRTKFLIPVEAVTTRTRGAVYVDLRRESVGSAPPYDPKLVADTQYLAWIYGYHDYPPYWARQHHYPTYPFYV